MPWNEVISDLEEKLINTLKGIFRPMDGIPFFRVLYPPKQEREAIKEFGSLAERLKQKGWKAELLSLTQVLEKALMDLLKCEKTKDLFTKLIELESHNNHTELKYKLGEDENLPEKMKEVIINYVKDQNLTKNSVLFLVRSGVIYPFMTPSHLLKRLEGKVQCCVVIAYPGTKVGCFLDSEPKDLYGSYYRGEIILWR